MERVIALVKDANKLLKTADHLIYMTYPLVKDIKLLTVVIDNLHKSLSNVMDAVLTYDRLYKRIPLLPEDYASKFELFKTKCAPRYNIPRENILLMEDIKKIIEHRKNSPIEFARQDKFVIYDRSFRMRTINYEKIKNYLNEVKVFMARINQIFLRGQDDRRI